MKKNIFKYYLKTHFEHILKFEGLTLTKYAILCGLERKTIYRIIKTNNANIATLKKMYEILRMDGCGLDERGIFFLDFGGNDETSI